MTAAKRERWNVDAYNRLCQALPGPAVDVISRDESVTLLRYGTPDLLLAVRGEDREAGPELCIVGIQGSGTREHWADFIALCKREGFKRLRCHTSIDEPAKRRLWAGLGFEPAEVISYREV